MNNDRQFYVKIARNSGMWLDGAELPYVSSLLGDLIVRRQERFTDARATGIDCHRCRGALYALEVGGVGIDWCRQCFGVWLDGGEYQTLEHDRPKAQSGESAPGMVQCDRCNQTVPLGRTFYCAAGLFCSSCHDGAKPVAMLNKPFSGATVLQQVREVLEA